MMTPKRLNIFFYVICSIGCAYQVSQILPIYFGYSLRSELFIEVTEAMKPHDLSYCQTYSYVFDFESYARDKKNLSYVFNANGDNRDGIPIRSIVTIAEIFKYTTNADDLIEGCGVKIPNSYDELVGLNKSECYKYFTVSKYYFQKFVCYRLHLKVYEHETYAYRPLKFSTGAPGTIYSVDIAPNPITRSQFLQAIVHRQNNYPHISASLVPTINNKYDKSAKRYHFNQLMITFSYLTVEKLPPPYSTMCGLSSTLGFHSNIDCTSKCITKLTIEKFNKLPFSVISTEPSNYTHIYLEDVKKRTKELDGIELKCSKLCYSDDCVSELTMTEVYPINYDGTYFRLWLTAPRNLNFRLIYHPQISIPELLVYVFSTIGTWLGISVLSTASLIASSFRRNSNEKDATSSYNRRIPATRIDEHYIQIIHSMRNEIYQLRTDVSMLKNKQRLY